MLYALILFSSIMLLSFMVGFVAIFELQYWAVAVTEIHRIFFHRVDAIWGGDRLEPGAISRVEWGVGLLPAAIPEIKELFTFSRGLATFDILNNPLKWFFIFRFSNQSSIEPLSELGGLVAPGGESVRARKLVYRFFVIFIELQFLWAWIPPAFVKCI